MDNLITGRVVVLFLACLLWGVFFTFYKVITLYSNNSVKRTFFGVLCIVASIGLIFFQIDSYGSITQIRKPIDNDAFFFWLVVLEGIIPMIVLFLMLYRDRNRNLKSQHRNSF